MFHYYCHPKTVCISFSLEHKSFSIPSWSNVVSPWGRLRSKYLFGISFCCFWSSIGIVYFLKSWRKKEQWIYSCYFVLCQRLFIRLLFKSNQNIVIIICLTNSCSMCNNIHICAYVCVYNCSNVCVYYLISSYEEIIHVLFVRPDYIGPPPNDVINN